MMVAVAADLFLYSGSVPKNSIVQSTAFAIATQAWIGAYTETVEIGFCRLALQMAEYHERADGDVSIVSAAAQGFFHCLGIVHLTIANGAPFAAESFTAAIGIFDKLL